MNWSFNVQTNQPIEFKPTHLEVRVLATNINDDNQEIVTIEAVLTQDLINGRTQQVIRLQFFKSEVIGLIIPDFPEPRIDVVAFGDFINTRFGLTLVNNS